MKKIIPVVFFLMFFSLSVFAQDETETGKNEFMLWGGYSPTSSTFSQGTGRTPNARFGIVAIRYSRRFNNNDKVNLKYTVDVVPFALLNYPDVEIISTTPLRLQSVRPTRRAFGIAPLGLQVNFRPRKKLQPFIGGSGGLAYFKRTTPNYVGAGFAFTADVGVGLEMKLKDKRALTIGYKYYHISNGNRGIENPGFDNNVFYVGYTFFSK